MNRSITVVLLVAAVGLSGCVYSRLHLTDDYGHAVRQNIAAQIDDPDAKYVGLPEAGASGQRVGLAQDRYDKGQVIRPASTSTASVAGGGGGPQ